MLRFPGGVNHRPSSCLRKPHGAVAVVHASAVVHLVVPRDLIAVVSLAMVSEELVRRHGASLVQQLETSRRHAVWTVDVARRSKVTPSDARRRRLEIVLVIELDAQQTTAS